MLFNYIAKAINTNARMPSSPFLRKKLILKNRITLYTSYQDQEPEEEENPYRENLKLQIKQCLEPPHALKIFGSA